MASVPFILAVIATVSIAAVLYKVWNRRSPTGSAPPGPTGLPIIGHLQLLFGNPPHLVLQKLAVRHGPLMSLRFGQVPVVVASNAAAATEILKTHDAVFASRPPTAMGRIFVESDADIVLARYGESWRHLRKIATLELLTTRRIDMFRGARMEEVRSLCRSLVASSRQDEIVDLRDRLTALTFNLITLMLVGKRYFGKNAIQNEETRKFVGAIADIFEVCGEFPVGDYFPWLPKFLDPVERRMKALARSLDEFLDANIVEHEKKKKTRTSQAQEDFLDVLLALRDSDEGLQDKNIKGMMANLVTAGTDTSSVTLEWALAETVKNPAIAARAREEIDRILGGDQRMVEETDIPQLRYLQAIVKETLRLHPAVPLLVPHQSMEPVDNVMGYHVQRGTTAIVNAYAVARDRSTWGPDALLFRPERFLDTELDVRGRDFGAVPFGSGRRQCPGMALALNTVHLTLANLLYGFEWRAPSGESIDTTNEKYGLTLIMANRLRLIASPRVDTECF